MTTRRNASLFWLLQCGGWAAFGAAMLSWALEFQAWPQAVLNKTLLVLLGFWLTLGFRAIYRRARERRLSLLAFALLVGGLSFGGAALWRELHEILLRAVEAALRGEAPAWFWVRIPLGTLLYDGFVLLAWSLLYNGVHAWQDLEQERERAQRAEALAREARLRALQFQLEPHFLFNTLNAISTLVTEGSGPAATRMIARLSDFLRLTLETADTPEISVAQELEFARGYLEIEQVRFGDRLAVSIEAGPEVMGGLVPALVLQPLIENAVRHGVLQRENGGSVAVAITRELDTLRLCVTNDGPGPDDAVPARHGVGLANTAARLSELYGPASRFSLGSANGTGTTASIEIPFRTTASRVAP